MKTANILIGVVLLAGSTCSLAQTDNPAKQWKRAANEANNVFLAGRKVYDSGNAPPTCASALKQQFELGQKVEDELNTALKVVNGMGGMQNPNAKAYFADTLRTASSEVVALDSNTTISCGLEQ